MISAVPSTARARSRAGSIAVVRNTTQVTPQDSAAAVSTPTLAYWSCSPVKARVAISRDTVKPIPAMVPPPATVAQPTGGRSTPRLILVTNHDPATMPTGFPSTYPTRMPTVIGEVYAVDRNDVSIVTPAERGC